MEKEKKKKGNITMAWYAELKRRHWYCINQWDAISWYHKYLYYTWYTSLTEEQKAKLKEQKRLADEKRKHELETTLMKFATMTSMVCGLYHDVYDHNDKNGFPIENLE